MSFFKFEFFFLGEYLFINWVYVGDFWWFKILVLFRVKKLYNICFMLEGFYVLF